MLTFLLRRLAASLVVLLVASYVVYVITCFSGDPLQDLRQSTSPNKAGLIAQRTALMHLDVSPFLRYFIWFGGLLKGFTGHFTLGVTSGGQAVTGQLTAAVGSTFQLVTGATLIAIVIGVALGVVTALRQYTAFDYGTTMMAFVFFSLPSFWLAVLLKEYLAIDFNNFLGHPVVPPVVIAIVALVAGVVAWSITERGRSRWWFVGGTMVVIAAFLTFISLTHWLDNPGLTIGGVAVLGVATAFGVSYLTAGKENKRSLYAALTTALVGVVLYYPLEWTVFSSMSMPLFLFLGVVAIAVGALVGWLWGGPDRRVSMRTGGVVAFLTAGYIAVDRFMQDWNTYVNSTYVNGRPIATIGSQTPNFDGDFWFTYIDRITHLALPTISLALISLAGYSRYARASMLDVMNQDYIRTARSKGLTERAVVMRHAFRNALIPVVTIVTLDFGALISGAIVTENVFSFQGMGDLFIAGVTAVDPNTIMGVFLVTGIWAIAFNVIADVLYSALDPRIRVTS
ncbi:MAG: ABC transporter permease [Nocardioidaceae bacterium]|nr:ABC transporter permease [Nocardioidaceae bacterium]MCL2612237.1 ABC transporter permease [Nocardioidaceae bacterium]